MKITKLQHKRPIWYTLHYSIPPTFYQNRMKDFQGLPKPSSRIFQSLVGTLFTDKDLEDPDHYQVNRFFRVPYPAHPLNVAKIRLHFRVIQLTNE